MVFAVLTEVILFFLGLFFVSVYIFLINVRFIVITSAVGCLGRLAIASGVSGEPSNTANLLVSV